MGKKIILFLMIFQSLVIQAQDYSISERKGTLKATGSFYPSRRLDSKVVNYYVGGNAEYFFHNNYSFRGDIYGLVGQKSPLSNSSLKTSFILNYGFNKHFVKNRFNSFVGIYTGMTCFKKNEMDLQTFVAVPSDVQYVPNVGLTIGTQFYLYDYFHFFAETRYIHHRSPYSNGNIDEISFSAGLGFQLPVKKLLGKKGI
jgi:hypothetical protein